MILITLLLSTLLVILNAIQNASHVSVSPIVMLIEHLCVLLFSYFIISNVLRRYTRRLIFHYYNLFLIAYTVSLFALYYNWGPDLFNLNSESFGFDPQRYYLAATNLLESGYIQYSLNYYGIVFFWYFFMAIFGASPLVPLYVNCLLSLYAILLLSTMLCEDDNRKMKYMALLLLIPEVVLYNAYSSREILCLSFATISLCYLYKYFKTRNSRYLLLGLVTISILTFIRPTISLPLLLGFMLFYALNKGKILSSIIIAIVFAAVFGLAQDLSKIGSNEFGYSISDSVEARVDEFGSNADMSRYSSNSMTSRLIPSNRLEFVVFGAIRTIFYVIPSPASFTQIFNIKGGQPPFYTEITTFLMFFSLPLLYRVIKRYKREKPKNKVLLIVLLLYMYVVSAFNPTILHVRYRIVYDLFFFGIILNELYKVRKEKTNKIWKAY